MIIRILRFAVAPHGRPRASPTNLSLYARLHGRSANVVVSRPVELFHALLIARKRPHC